MKTLYWDNLYEEQSKIWDKSYTVTVWYTHLQQEQKQTYRHIDRQSETDGHIDRQSETDGHIDRQRDRETDRETNFSSNFWIPYKRWSIIW